MRGERFWNDLGSYFDGSGRVFAIGSKESMIYHPDPSIVKSRKVQNIIQKALPGGCTIFEGNHAGAAPAGGNKKGASGVEDDSRRVEERRAENGREDWGKRFWSDSGCLFLRVSRNSIDF